MILSSAVGKLSEDVDYKVNPLDIFSAQNLCKRRDLSNLIRDASHKAVIGELFGKNY